MDTQTQKTVCTDLEEAFRNLTQAQFNCRKAFHDKQAKELGLPLFNQNSLEDLKGSVLFGPFANDPDTFEVILNGLPESDLTAYMDGTIKRSALLLKYKDLDTLLKHDSDLLMVCYLKDLIAGKKPTEETQNSFSPSATTLLHTIKIELSKHGYMEAIRQPRRTEEICWLWWLLSNEYHTYDGHEHGAKKIFALKPGTVAPTAKLFCDFFDCPAKFQTVKRYKVPPGYDTDYIKFRKFVRSIVNPKKLK